MKTRILTAILVAFLACIPLARAEEAPKSQGKVTLPLAEFLKLTEPTPSPSGTTRAPAPVPFSLARGQYRIVVQGDWARIQADLAVRVLSGGFQEIPLLPTDVVVQEARLDGKPVVLLLDLPGKYYAERANLDNRWNIRFASVNMETNVDQRNKGFWSWMDNEATSVPGPDGKPEAITASIGCFNSGGWLDPGSHGRRGGATFVEDWQTVMRDKPQHIFIHQFQEFAGQPEGQGYGPNKDRYVDSYSVDLSDDVEPVSLTTPAYRGKGGWGYFYLNLNKALVDLLRQKTLETSVLVVAKPDRRHEVTGDSMELEWRTVGKSLADGVTIAIDGKVVATSVKEPSLKVDISKLKPGLHTITLTAPGAMQRYRLAWDDDSLPLAQLEPATVSMEFLRK